MKNAVPVLLAIIKPKGHKVSAVWPAPEGTIRLLARIVFVRFTPAHLMTGHVPNALLRALLLKLSITAPMWRIVQI
jgi:hypothetical protein